MAKQQKQKRKQVVMARAVSLGEGDRQQGEVIAYLRRPDKGVNRDNLELVEGVQPREIDNLLLNPHVWRLQDEGDEVGPGSSPATENIPLVPWDELHDRHQQRLLSYYRQAPLENLRKVAMALGAKADEKADVSTLAQVIAKTQHEMLAFKPEGAGNGQPKGEPAKS